MSAPSTVQAAAPEAVRVVHPRTRPLRVALVGNPNTGKTTLFNGLCGLRHKTSNFPGTTQEARSGRAGDGVEIVDLPGVYSLELDLSESRVCRDVLAGTLAPAGQETRAPDAVCVVVDSANLERNLTLVGEVMRRRLPMAVALNMIDVARSRGVAPDAAALSGALRCPVVPCCARSGEGLDALRAALAEPALPNATPPGTVEGLEDWAAATARSVLPAGARPLIDRATDRADRVLTHPVAGLAVFGLVMLGLFWTIFRLAEFPMALIEGVFSGQAAWVAAWQPAWLRVIAGEGLVGAVRHALPDGIIEDFLAGGVVAGVGATVVFLPQICLLFFLISLLEDTGYLARAAFLVDRFMRPFGLSGYAFVPFLSSHACALPGIMATRAIPDRRERLGAILSAPFMSCSARIPVYVLLTSLLFPGRPGMQALAFAGCYALGAAAGLLSALIARRTILRGRSRALAMELPTYKRPSLRSAALLTLDRAAVFLKKAGTNILAITIVLWWLSAYPKVEAPPEAASIREQAALATDPAEAEALATHADELAARDATARSFLGRIGRTVQPVFEPLGYDWQLSVGVIASFAAREVFASTMAVITTGDEDASALERIAEAKRADGVTPVFTPAASWSLLVYFVLAMQCLPTLAVTARESGAAKWALLQLVWMCGVAYAAALVVYHVMA
ncbi:MAG TPA: ferrous iron transporter B [Phycisphaerales bacterium]|nr:ferrous iron transporter B [Phycisphaerales bacterium]